MRRCLEDKGLSCDNRVIHAGGDKKAFYFLQASMFEVMQLMIKMRCNFK